MPPSPQTKCRCSVIQRQLDNISSEDNKNLHQ
jgi:hypothetical protein